jgi:quercetin dioxygenase-like cupin family protein
MISPEAMNDGPGYTILHKDQLERNGSWSLARRSLGVEAFGINIVDIKPGDRIPEHDETARDQEEVFVVLRGRPTLMIDGTPHLIPAGSLARLDPHVKRTIVNDGDRLASVLVVSAPRTSGYQPMVWA